MANGARSGDVPALAMKERPGDAGVNISCGLARFGVWCIVGSRAGNDEAERRLVEHLATSRVEPSFVRVGGTAGTVISVGGRGATGGRCWWPPPLA